MGGTLWFCCRLLEANVIDIEFYGGDTQANVFDEKLQR